eukprot:14872114-Alexandrium_andersonii.AAC.1
MCIRDRFSKEAGKGEPLREQYKECKTWAAKAALQKAWAERKYQEVVTKKSKTDTYTLLDSNVGTYF